MHIYMYMYMYTILREYTQMRRQQGSQTGIYKGLGMSALSLSLSLSLYNTHNRIAEMNSGLTRQQSKDFSLLFPGEEARDDNVLLSKHIMVNVLL